MTEEEKLDKEARDYVLNAINNPTEDPDEPKDPNAREEPHWIWPILMIAGVFLAIGAKYGFAGLMVWLCFIFGFFVFVGIVLPWLISTISR